MQVSNLKIWNILIIAIACSSSQFLIYNLLFQWVAQLNVLEIIAQFCDGQNREMQDFFRDHVANEQVKIVIVYL